MKSDVPVSPEGFLFPQKKKKKKVYPENSILNFEEIQTSLIDKKESRSFIFFVAQHKQIFICFLFIYLFIIYIYFFGGVGWGGGGGRE